MDYLYEIRSRIIRIVIGFLIAFGCVYPFANQIHTFFIYPLLSQLPKGGTLIATSVSSPFLIPLKIALYVAFAASLPHTLYQIWKFVQPGLYPKERFFSVLAVVSSLILFSLGASFGFYIVIPVVIKFVVGAAPLGVAVMTEIGNYLDFLLSIILAFGLSFQTPIVVIGLVFFGIVDIKTLKEIRSYVIVGAFVIGAIFTPPDIISQCLLAIPLWLLYEVGILAAIALVPKRVEESLPAHT